MRDSRDKKAAEIQDSIRQILYHDWNPIGFSGLPQDEYDHYIAPVYRILAEGRSEQELVEFLFRTGEDILVYSCELICGMRSGVECGATGRMSELRA